MMSRLDCISFCERCHAACSEAASRSLDQASEMKLGAREVDALIRCAAACQATVRILRDQDLTGVMVCETCAAICEQCSTLLAPNAGLRECAWTALQCAKICRDLAAS